MMIAISHQTPDFSLFPLCSVGNPFPIGKPHSGKANVRFDEGDPEIELFATTPALYSTGSGKCRGEREIFKEGKKFFLYHFPLISARPIYISIENGQSFMRKRYRFSSSVLLWY